MEIKDRRGITRIKLTEFKKPFNQDPIFLDILISVSMSNFQAEQKISIELSEIKIFVRGLKKLHETLKGICFFYQLDKLFELKFEIQNTGSIKVSGFLKDTSYSNTLSFSFEMDQSQLPQLINEFENIIDVIETKV